MILQVYSTIAENRGVSSSLASGTADEASKQTSASVAKDSYHLGAGGRVLCVANPIALPSAVDETKAIVRAQAQRFVPNAQRRGVRIDYVSSSAFP